MHPWRYSLLALSWLLVSLPATVGATTLASLTLSTPKATGGALLTGTVAISSASFKPITIPLVSSNPSVAAVPVSVTVGGRHRTTGNFAVVTNPVTEASIVIITAAYGGVIQKAVLTVFPPMLASITFNPATVGCVPINVAASTTEIRLALTGPAPAGGLPVGLVSSNPTVLAVPASVTVPAGASSVSLSRLASVVWQPTDVAFTASHGRVTKQAVLRVQATYVTGSYDGNEPSTGGSPRHWWVRLPEEKCVAPSGGIDVKLTSSNPAVAKPPESVVIAAGTNKTPFVITTFPVAQTVQISLRVSWVGGQADWPLTVFPPKLIGVSLNPYTVKGGATTLGTVTLDGPVASGASVPVSLVSSTPAVATVVPVSVAVAAGAASTTFQVTTKPVGQQVNVTITATSSGPYGAISKTRNLYVTP